jgi:transcription elongation factor GreB
VSRAFVKENDLEHAGIDIPERPISHFTNYVTPLGLEQLKEQLKNVENDLKNLKKDDTSSSIEKKFRLERDLRYFLARIKSAITVDPSLQDKNKVLFSAKVDVIDENDLKYTYQIVGEDEADSTKNKISYISPLAQALIGSKVGDEVIWERPIGNSYLYIDKIYYN